MWNMWKLVVSASIAISILSCGALNTKPGRAVIDCVTADHAQLEGLLSELGPLASGDKPDWTAISLRAKDAGKVIGGCR